MDYSIIMQFIKPELVILIPVLYAIGAAIKASPVASEYIPIILGAAGVILAMLYVMGTSDIDGSIANSIFVGVTQGILLAGASVYTHQIFKQFKD